MKKYIFSLIAMAFICIGTVSAQRFDRHHDRHHDKVEVRHHDRHHGYHAEPRHHHHAAPVAPRHHHHHAPVVVERPVVVESRHCHKSNTGAVIAGAVAGAVLTAVLTH